MSFTHEIWVGESYSLDTHIRFRPPFKIQFMKLTKRPQAALSSNQKTSTSDGKTQVSTPSPLKRCATRKADEDARVVRQGEVCVRQCGVHPRNWFRKDRWLALSETQLTVHPSKTKVPRSHILLSDIARLERTEVVPHGLALQTKNERRYLLIFQNDSDLYGWQDDISCRSMGVGVPYNFVHEAHASFDPVTGGITGLPPGWDKVLLGEKETSERSNKETLLPINLKIFPDREETHLTNVSVTPEMQIQDVLELVCRKMKFQAPDYTLALTGGVEALDMARSVGDLDGKRELVMVKRRASAPPSPVLTNGADQ
ncbi:hypothetical protein FB451DRAFT_1240048 [Mycena latifolia]|nr:hypothetical protein FB451DRAFT_1240048 [Mycena latifolia]